MSKKSHKKSESNVEDSIDSTSVLPINISLPEDIKGKTIYEQKILNEHITDEDKVYLNGK